MPIPVVCPTCATRLRAPDNTIGRQSKCPRCGSAIKIPGTVDAEAESTESKRRPRYAKLTEPGDYLPQVLPAQDLNPSLDASAFGRQSHVQTGATGASDFITLNCPSCGGSLKVTESTDRFVCKYCSKEHIIRRQGNIIVTVHRFLNRRSFVGWNGLLSGHDGAGVCRMSRAGCAYCSVGAVGGGVVAACARPRSATGP